MDLKSSNYNIEQWFINRPQTEFPDEIDYVSNYKSIVDKLEPIHKQVNAGADFTDKTTLTRHDISHINKVIKKISHLLSYRSAKLSPYEVFILLVAVQIHDIKNIDGRDEHENNAVEIFNDLGIQGLIDSRLLKNIGFIASCHAGSYMRENKKEKDKIGFLLQPLLYLDKFQIRPQFLSALLRLGDEYADDMERAMTHLLKIGKIKKDSIIHQKYAESLRNVAIKSDTGIVEFDFYLKIKDAVCTFPKYLKDENKYEEKFLLDEIFERTVKSHYETIYCMRFLRPLISVNKIKVTIEVEKTNVTDKTFTLPYEMIEKGYPNENLGIIDLCGESLRKNGDYWNGKNLKDFLEKRN